MVMLNRFRLVLLLQAYLVSTMLSGCSAPVDSKRYEDYPAFNAGGTMTLTVEGQAYTVKLGSILFVNTDDGYNDFVEIEGVGTHIVATCANKDLDFDSESSYAPLVNASLPLGAEESDDAMTVELPGLGNYAVTSGALTLQKFQIGRDGHDWWDGQISITVETTNGSRTISGPFSWCIVPVW